MVQKCVYKYVHAIMILVKTTPGMRQIKESGGGGESKYDIFDTL
jgi:hypothetical protein